MTPVREDASKGNPAVDVRLEPWAAQDLTLLRRSNTPAMTEHLGGPETEEQLLARHERYLRHWRNGTARMFKVVIDGAPEGAGSVGYWEKSWQGALVYETGWSTLPEFQGRGIASAAVAAVLAHAGREGLHRFVHAFPGIGNHASNAVCRRAGFVLALECTFEYPPGHLMRCNDWVFDLARISADASSDSGAIPPG